MFYLFGGEALKSKYYEQISDRLKNNQGLKTTVLTKSGKTLKVSVYTTGDFIPCLGIPNKKVPLSEFIKSRDINGLVLQIKRAVKIIKEQKCPTN